MKPWKNILMLPLTFMIMSSAAAQVPSNSTLKQYFFVMLEKGPHRDQDSVTAAKIQQEHLANITRLHDEGKLEVAGPFLDDGDWKGIFIFNVPTKEEVERILQSDAAIKAGRLIYEIHPWMTQKGGSFH